MHVVLVKVLIYYYSLANMINDIFPPEDHRHAFTRHTRRPTQVESKQENLILLVSILAWLVKEEDSDILENY